MQNKIVGLIAPKGSGKTHYIAGVMQQLPRNAVFDMVHEAAYLCAEPITGRPRQFAEMLKQEQFSIAYRPVLFRMNDGEEYCPEFEPWVKLCYLRGDMWMIIDEAHLLCTAHKIPAPLLQANRLGRHRELSIAYITQSFSAVARPMTENTDEFVFWKIIEPNDLEGIRKRCGMEVRDQVQALRRLSYDKDGKAIPGQRLRWSTYEGVMEVTE